MLASYSFFRLLSSFNVFLSSSSLTLSLSRSSSNRCFLFKPSLRSFIESISVFSSDFLSSKSIIIPSIFSMSDSSSLTLSVLSIPSNGLLHAPQISEFCSATMFFWLIIMSFLLIPILVIIPFNSSLSRFSLYSS